MIMHFGSNFSDDKRTFTAYCGESVPAESNVFRNYPQLETHEHVCEKCQALVYAERMAPR